MKKVLTKSLILLAVLVFLAVCGVLYFYIYVIPDISGALTQTVVLEHEEWDVTVAARCIIIRDEKVIRAQESGTVSYYAEENVKERKGSKAADVYPAGGAVSSYLMEETGVVSYFTDGYESYFTLENADTIDPAWAQTLDITAQSCVRTEVTAGDVLYKVINSDTWMMALMMDPEDAAEFSEGQKITVLFGEEEADRITANVVSVADKGTKWLVTARTGLYYEPEISLRTADVTILTRTCEGLSIPNTAVGTDADGNPGVWVSQIDGTYAFTRIQILREGTENCLAAQGSFTETGPDGETVTISSADLYDEVLRNAGDAE